MEPEQTQEVFQEKEQPSALKTLHAVTPLSKYLAMTLFIILPFLGGWIGYTFAPEKIVEVERVVIKEVAPDVTHNLAEDKRITITSEGMQHTYENGYWGFRVTYPTDWFKSEHEGPPLEFFDNNGGRFVILDKCEKHASTAIEDWELEPRDSCGSGGESGYTKIKIGTHDALKTKFEPLEPDGPNRLQFLIDGGDMVLRIAYDSDESYSAIYEEIASSIEFFDNE